MKKTFYALVALAVIFLIGLSGCATKGFVQEQISQVMDPVKAQAEANKTEIETLKKTTEQQTQQQQKLSETNQEAVARAMEAFDQAEEVGKLATGKFLFEVTFSDDSVQFDFDKGDLTDEDKIVLSNFAARIKAQNKNVHIEIQGHTDSIGTEEYNLWLGQVRAESVRNYLYTQHGVSLHHMSTFSYGESKPLVENDTPENRAMNRRITFVVIDGIFSLTLRRA
ncbi:MAG: OmpA family protein [Candidatus Aminicenantes bacterium]|nr:OmpA family protein [Candidatus Aminicenantes bacterium]